MGHGPRSEGHRVDIREWNKEPLRTLEMPDGRECPHMLLRSCR